MFGATFYPNEWVDTLDEFKTKFEKMLDENKAAKAEWEALDPYQKLKCLVFSDIYSIGNMDRGFLYKDFRFRIEALDIKHLYNLAAYVGIDVNGEYITIDDEVSSNVAVLHMIMVRWHEWKRAVAKYRYMSTKVCEYARSEYPFVDELDYDPFYYEY
nr:MAG TPA: hypothetical protein [Caudoviricetes sp.]